MTDIACLCPSVVAWLDAWQNHIQAKNFDAGADLFSSQAHGFGTVVVSAHDLAELRHCQWETVWARTQGFVFLHETARAWGGATFQTVAIQWRSEGIDALDGSVYTRTGRATIVLQRDDAQHMWLGVHTHFSIDPSTERFLPVRVEAEC